MPRPPIYAEKYREWLVSLRMRGRARNTIDTYANAGRQWQAFAKETGWPSDPRKISPLNVLEWYEELREESSSNTQDDYVRCLQRFLKWAKNDLCTDLDLRIRPARTGRVDWLDSALQIGQFIRSGANVWDRAVATVIAHTAARASEAADLRVEDMHQDYILLRGKGRADRNVPVDKEFWEDLAEYRKYRSSLATSSDRFLVHLWRGTVTEYRERTINKVVTRMGVSFGRHVSPHTLRRTFGRVLWDNGRGMPLPILARIMGHKSVEQTIDYLGIGDADLSGAMAAFKPSFR
jgi:integrase